MPKPITAVSFASIASLFCAIFCVMLLSSPVRAAEATPPAAVYNADETKAFKALAEATIQALDAGKEKEMVANITDLETAWDAKEDVLKPKNPATWTRIDKTLDKAISAIRGSKPDLKKGKAALQALVKELEQATKP